MTYAMFSDTALHKFREFCDAANFSKPRSNSPGAFDARPRYARDQAPDKDHLIFSLLGVIDDLRPKGGANDQEPYTDIPDKLSALSEHLKGTMQPDAFKEAEEMIIELIERCEELIGAAHENENRRNAVTGDDEDQPPKFEGRPQRGGEPAMDTAALASFNARFPGAARIGHAGAGMGEQPPVRRRAASTAEVESFAARFPSASRIGNL